MRQDKGSEVKRDLVPDADEWDSEMQSEWVIELDAPCSCTEKNRLSATQRPGDFRISTCIIAESWA